jgi:endonuclease III
MWCVHCQGLLRVHSISALNTKNGKSFDPHSRIDMTSFQSPVLDILHQCNVSFYRRKAEYLHRCAAILELEYDSDIPDSSKGLVSLPGVGPKIAYLVLAVAWGKLEGICVDTHVHRISNRLGWADSTSPEQTRKQVLFTWCVSLFASCAVFTFAKSLW